MVIADATVIVIFVEKCTTCQILLMLKCIIENIVSISSRHVLFCCVPNKFTTGHNFTDLLIIVDF